MGWGGDWSGGKALERAMLNDKRAQMRKPTFKPGQTIEGVLKNRAVSVPAHATHKAAAALGN